MLKDCTTSYEVWRSVNPNMLFLYIWRYDPCVKRLEPNKLDPKSDKYYLVGYVKILLGILSTMGMRTNYLSYKNKVLLEKEFSRKKKVSGGDSTT